MMGTGDRCWEHGRGVLSYGVRQEQPLGSYEAKPASLLDTRPAVATAAGSQAAGPPILPSHFQRETACSTHQLLPRPYLSPLPAPGSCKPGPCITHHGSQMPPRPRQGRSGVSHPSSEQKEAGAGTVFPPCFLGTDLGSHSCWLHPCAKLPCLETLSTKLSVSCQM